MIYPNTSYHLIYCTIQNELYIQSDIFQKRIFSDFWCLKISYKISWFSENFLVWSSYQLVCFSVTPTNQIYFQFLPTCERLHVCGLCAYMPICSIGKNAFWIYYKMIDTKSVHTFKLINSSTNMAEKMKNIIFSHICPSLQKSQQISVMERWFIFGMKHIYKRNFFWRKMYTVAVFYISTVDTVSYNIRFFWQFFCRLICASIKPIKNYSSMTDICLGF